MSSVDKVNRIVDGKVGLVENFDGKPVSLFSSQLLCSLMSEYLSQ